MAKAVIVSAYRDRHGLVARCAAYVDEDDDERVEYLAETPLLDAEGRPKSAADLRRDLVAAVKARRDAQRARDTPVGGLKAGDEVDL